MLQWAELDPEKLERAAQLLVREACGATSVDGRGGDLAQDLRHDGPDGLTLYEVKSFTKRLNSNQKRQITASLSRAVQIHAPRRWVLVIPLNPSPAELAWFDGLRAKFPDVELDWYGLDWLDGQIAGRDGVISYVEGAQSKLLRRAQQYDMERAALTSGADLTQRMNGLLELGETISPYWKWHFGDTPYGPGQILTPQRPEAATEDPVQLTPSFSFPPDDPEARMAAERLQRVLRLGGDVEIPGRYIDELRVTAASEATQRLLGEPSQQVTQLRLISIPSNAGLPLRGSLVLEQGNGQDGLSVPFTFTDGVAGTHGRTLTGTDHSGQLEGRLEVEAGNPAIGRMHLTLKPVAGYYPHDVLPPVRLMATCTAGDNLHFRRGPVTIASFNGGAETADGLPGLHRLVAALEVLQDHLGTLIAVPAEHVSEDDLRTLFAMAQALSGQRARLPYTGLSMQLRPGAIGEFLAKVPTEPGALYGSQHGIEITLDGRSYDVPGLALWAPNVVLQNRDELEALVAADADAAALATFTGPEDDGGIFLIRAVEDPGAQYRRVLELS